MLPWAKANINPTGQALIISTGTLVIHRSNTRRSSSTEHELLKLNDSLNLAVAGMAYFIAADKKILSLARRHSYEEAPEHLKNTSFQGAGRPHPAFFRP